MLTVVESLLTTVLFRTTGQSPGRSCSTYLRNGSNLSQFYNYFNLLYKVFTQRYRFYTVLHVGIVFLFPLCNCLVIFYFCYSAWVFCITNSYLFWSLCKTVPDKGKPWFMYEAYQHIIKVQVEYLIRIGVDPALKVKIPFFTQTVVIKLI